MSITAITLTGDRKEAFQLCTRWMSNQTVKPDQWIVVDDGKEPLEIPENIEMDYLRRVPSNKDPQHTMVMNLQLALNGVESEKILIMEDDEYYAPNYIEEMSRKLYEYELVGIGHSKYYHLPSGGFIVHKNMDHASFAQTGFRSTLLSELNKIMEGDQFLDIRLWKEVALHKNSHIFVDTDPLYLGMKGLPGRKGIGVGHVEKIYKNFDKDRSFLKSITNEDFKHYKFLI